MNRILLHIYDPININSYGLCIALGIMVTVCLIQKHPLFTKLSLEKQFQKIVFLTVIAALAGGRLLYLFEQPEAVSLSNIFAFWEGGFSIMGSVIAATLTLSWYSFISEIPILSFLDLLSLHAPLLQSISRIGCFFAGCCYGKPTSLPIGVIYTDHESLAPLGCKLHPSQLYSAIALMMLFGLLYCVLERLLIKPGQLLGCYLIGIGLERFVLDLFRDRTHGGPEIFFLSVAQCLSAAIFVSGVCVLLWTSLRNNKKS